MVKQDDDCNRSQWLNQRMKKATLEIILNSGTDCFNFKTRYCMSNSICAAEKDYEFKSVGNFLAI